ncbi:MAG: MFS transporter, partial [Chloroflexi bacterium]|nr:MFS transporter [Chloroflexota bacterium]
MGDDLDQAMIRDGQYVFHHKADLARRERVVLPVVHERLVIRLSNAIRPCNQFALVAEAFDFKVASLHYPLGNAHNPLGDLEVFCRKITRNEIHLLDESLRLDQLLVVGIIVVQHRHRLTMFMSENQDSISIQRTHTLRPNDRIQSTRSRPLEGGIEQRLGGLVIVFAFEQVKIRFACLMIGIEGFVLDHCNAADVPSITRRQKEIHIGVLVKGMLPAVQLIVGVNVQRRHPLAATGVQPLRELDKPPHLPPILGIHFRDSNHGHLQSEYPSDLYDIVSPMFNLPGAFWLLFAGTLINRIGGFVVPFLALYLTSHRGLPVAQAGLIVSLFGAGSFLAQLIGGELADRFGRKPVLLISFLAAPAFVVSLGLAKDLGLIALCPFN